MARRLNWERCRFTYSSEPTPPDNLEKRAKAELEDWINSRSGGEAVQRPQSTRSMPKLRAMMPKRRKRKSKAKSATVPGGRRLGNLIKQVTKELAEFDEQVDQVRHSIALMRNGPRKLELQVRLESVIRGEGPEPSPVPRAKWDSSQWLIEAEYQKSAARKYRQAGQLDRARKCEAAARKAQHEGLRLRAQGR